MFFRRVLYECSHTEILIKKILQACHITSFNTTDLKAQPTYKLCRAIFFQGKQNWAENDTVQDRVTRLGHEIKKNSSVIIVQHMTSNLTSAEKKLHLTPSNFLKK